jgi:hypothetical protein
MDEFMRMAGLTLTDVLDTLKALAHEGFVTKTGKGYTIAEKGKLALIALSRLPNDKAFHFYLGMEQPTGVSAESVKEFYNVVETVALSSLEFHLEREDFEKWFKTAVQDDVFAGELAGLRETGLKGEALRMQILLGLQTRYGEDVLRREWAS